MSPRHDDFFAGVEQMRAYFDRGLHDPAHRRTRLVNTARDLLKPRGARAMTWWLGSQVHEALGGDACAVWVNDAGWAPWYRTGLGGGGLPAQMLAALQGDAIVTSRDGMAVPLPGLDGPVAVLWIEGGDALDEEVETLLTAIAGTAGMVLDQALRSEALVRDPQTGLLSRTGFLDLAGAEMRQVPPRDRAFLLIRLRVTVGGDSPKERLALAARSCVPPGSPLAIFSSETHLDLVAAPPVLPTASAAMESGALAAAVATAYGPGSWRASYHVSERAVDDLSGLLEELAQAIGRASPDNLVRV